MTTNQFLALFEAHADKYLEFHPYVSQPRSQRPDLHAFLLIDELCPGKTNLISASEHDEFYLAITLDELCEKINETQLIELIACGVRYDRGYDCFCMFS